VTGLIFRADPGNLDDLSRNFRPMNVYEHDLTGIEARVLGLDVDFRGNYRVLVVTAVSKTDANKMRRLAKNLGPATGLGPLIIPCNGENDWAYVQEMMESRFERNIERAKARIHRMAERQKWQDEMMTQLGEHLVKKQRGLSTFGPGGQLQRVS
jgi:hypothetical protein